MNKKEIIEALRGGDSETKVELLRELTQMHTQGEIIEEIISRLEDKDERVRFSALDILIKKIPAEITTRSATMIPKLIELLMDDFHPVVDRAIWALSITGSKSVESLLDVLPLSQAKERILMALGHNVHLANYREKVIEAFLLALTEKNDTVRFTAMCTLIDRSPARRILGNTIEDFDFSPVYRKVLPVAEGFIKSENQDYQEWGNRYKNLIEQELKDKGTA